MRIHNGDTALQRCSVATTAAFFLFSLIFKEIRKKNAATVPQRCRNDGLNTAGSCGFELNIGVKCLSGLDKDVSGLKTAVAAVHNSAAQPIGSMRPIQHELLPLPSVLTETGSENGAENVSEVRGRGRPAGAKNKSTKEWQAFLLSQYRSPLVVLAETYSRDVIELSRQLSCSLLEAFKIQLAAAKELAPYVHQKMPQAVELGEGGLIQLTINTGKLDGGASNPELLEAIEMLPIETEENSGFAGGEISQSNKAKSNESLQSNENSQFQGETHAD